MTANYTNQTAFDTAARHLLKQGKKAQEGGNCRYRAPDGLKCAVGCLIEPEDYSPDIEGKAIITVRRRFPYLRDLDFNLLMDLQDIHDSLRPEEWPSVLRSVAAEYGLDTTCLEACT